MPRRTSAQPLTHLVEKVVPLALPCLVEDRVLVNVGQLVRDRGRVVRDLRRVVGVFRIVAARGTPQLGQDLLRTPLTGL